MKYNLEILPLTLKQLEKYLANDFSLEKELCLEQISRSLSADLKDALETSIIPAVEASADDCFFSTLWTIIDRDKNAMVGDLCFYGPPNVDGETELGYGTYESFRNKGYMTEAVRLLISQANKRDELRCIKASTLNSNPASGAVLIKNGFVVAGKQDEFIHWVLFLHS